MVNVNSAWLCEWQPLFILTVNLRHYSTVTRKSFFNVTGRICKSNVYTSFVTKVTKCSYKIISELHIYVIKDSKYVSACRCITYSHMHMMHYT